MLNFSRDKTLCSDIGIQLDPLDLIQADIFKILQEEGLRFKRLDIIKVCEQALMGQEEAKRKCYRWWRHYIRTGELNDQR